ncbi:MAG TPA: cyclic nucleotide-binding domain-containing protein, partial [Candidatus Eremiobacteraeota bacterium]|nr:cyclic nucleotide-binding domain-containing protein [Candidatus Eremiobacteraeota bacterium]
MAYKIYVQSYVHPMMSSPRVYQTPLAPSRSINIVPFLSRVSLFQNISSEDLEHIASLVKYKKIPENTVIFKEDDTSKEIYIINSGRVSIRKYLDRANKKEEELILLREGAIFGEMSAVDNQRRSATAVVVMGDAELYIITSRDFIDILEKYSRVSINLNKIYSHRLRETNTRVMKYLHYANKLRPVPVDEKVEARPLVPPMFQQSFMLQEVKPVTRVETKSTGESVTEEKKSQFTLISLKYISVSVKCRHFLSKKDIFYEILKKAENLIVSSGSAKELDEIHNKLQEYKAMFQLDIDRLKERGIPHEASHKFKKAGEILLQVLSDFKKALEDLVMAIEVKDINTFKTAENEIDKAFTNIT